MNHPNGLCSERNDPSLGTVFCLLECTMRPGAAPGQQPPLSGTFSTEGMTRDMGSAWRLRSWGMDARFRRYCLAQDRLPGTAVHIFPVSTQGVMTSGACTHHEKASLAFLVL